MNLHSPGYVLTDIVAWALRQAGYAPVHCSGFSAPEGTVLVLAPPNTGKTLTTMMACMEMGAGYLAEDVAITDGTNLYAVPWTSTFRYYEHIGRQSPNTRTEQPHQGVPPGQNCFPWPSPAGSMIFSVAPASCRRRR